MAVEHPKAPSLVAQRSFIGCFERSRGDTYVKGDLACTSTIESWQTLKHTMPQNAAQARSDAAL